MIRAVGKRIIVRLVEVEKQRIILQVDERKQWQTARVISVGDEVEGVYEDNFVWFRAHAGLILGYDDVEYLSLDISEVLGVAVELA